MNDDFRPVPDRYFTTRKFEKSQVGEALESGRKSEIQAEVVTLKRGCQRRIEREALTQLPVQQWAGNEVTDLKIGRRFLSLCQSRRTQSQTHDEHRLDESGPRDAALYKWVFFGTGGIMRVRY
jgi:hypothetical protein